MRFKIQNKYVLWGLTAFIVILASILFVYALFNGSAFQTGAKKLGGVLTPLALAMISAYLLAPILNGIEYRILVPLCDSVFGIPDSIKRKRVLRLASTTLTMIFFFLMLYGLVAMLLSQIIPSIQSIVVNMDTYYNNFILWLNQVLEDNQSIQAYALKYIEKYSSDFETWLDANVLSRTSEIIKTVSQSVLSVIKGFWNFLLGVMISVYLLARKEEFASQAKKVVFAVFEREFANQVLAGGRFVHRTFIGFIGGKIVDSIIIGLLCFVGTSLLGTPYAALVSLVVGATNVIPFFGPFIGAIPCALLILVVDPLNPLHCLKFIIFIFVLQQFDGNVLGPKILGDSTGITGFWVIFAITFFGGIMGVPGMIVGVPIFAIIYAAIKSLTNRSLANKGMPQATQEYLFAGAVDADGKLAEMPPKHLQRSEQKQAVRAQDEKKES